VRTQRRAGAPPLCHAFAYTRTTVDVKKSGVSAAAPAVAQEAGRDSFCKSVAARPNPSFNPDPLRHCEAGHRPAPS
jgi:hypothetical protein